jgi:Raf kinase inhibitor-like YbhB/YbcL family protein
MKKIIIALFALVVFTAYVCQAEEGGGGMKLTSPAFEHNKSIPSKYTCQGEDVNPALAIDDIPEGTKSLALIVDDPDAPMGTWVHWVVYDIAPTSRIIDENSIPGKQGINDFRKKNYGGPCPPSGTHRYFFKVYALDTQLNLEEGINKRLIKEI